MGRKPESTPIPLNPEQAQAVAGKIAERWDGQRGLRLDGGRLESLMEHLGPQAKVAEVLKRGNPPQSGPKQ